MLLFVGVSVNSIGSWASAIAIWGFAAYRFSAGPYEVSLLVICWAAPSAVLSPVLGVHLDRLGARRALVFAYLAATGAAIAMALAGSLVWLDIAAFIYGAIRSLSGPAANALPPQLMMQDDLAAANALLGAASQVGQVLGPVVASIAIAIAGFRAAFVFDAVTYVVGAVVIASLPLLPRDAHPSRPWRSELSDGVAAVGRTRPLRLILLLGATVSFTSSGLLVVEPLYARHVLHRPAAQFALFEAAAGVGAVVAGLILPRLRRHLTGGGIIALAAVAYGVAACIFVGTTSLIVAYVGVSIWGMTAALFSTVELTRLQIFAAPKVLGRVMAIRSTVEAGIGSLGLLLAGVIVKALGIRGGGLTLAAVAVLGGLSALTLRR